MTTVYWTTKDGRKLDIDEMDEQHVRNCLKMLVRRLESMDEEEEEWYDNLPPWDSIDYYRFKP